MGDEIQVQWLSANRDLLRGAVLEVGARRYDVATGFDLRRRLGHEGTWVGTDLNPGPGVDVVADLSAPSLDVERQLGGRRFDAVVCLSVIEHVVDIFRFASNLTSLTAPGGHLFLSVPWVWRYHAYPTDCWRLSPTAVQFLFSGFEVDGGRTCMHGQARGTLRALDLDPLKSYAPAGLMTRTLARSSRIRRLLERLGRTPPQLLAPTMLDFCLRRAAAPATGGERAG